MRNRVSIDYGYEDDWGLGRTQVDGDGMFILDASVDGQGGQIRNKPVFTAEQAADYLNRGDDLLNGLKTGAVWRGAFDTIANPRAPEYGTAKPTGYVSGPLTELKFGFYNTVADIDPAYAYIPSSTQAGKLRLDGFSAFSTAQRDAARQAIAAWDELVAIKFVETSSAQADINFMNTTTGPAQASAYLPWDYGVGPEKDANGNLIDWNRVAGDVAVNPLQASNQIFDEGQYGLTTLVHELGHSLGLQHPGDYNFAPGFAVTYQNGADYYQDSYQYTLMSYWGGEETGMQQVDWKNLTYRYNSTPGVHDILAIQKLYGADYSTRNGNDTYGFNTKLSTVGLGDDNYDFVKTPAPVIAIWDGGGIDTLDLSGYNTPSIIDLNPGAMSSAGGTEQFLTLEQINANRAAEGAAPRTQATLDLYNSLFKDPYGLTNGLMKDNIGIAYNVIIENAVGGGGNDVITGNKVGNILKGNAGNDTIKGGDGTDVITLGVGADKFVAEFNTNKVNTKVGDVSFDVITDFDGTTDKIDLKGIDAVAGGNDQAFTWIGTSANKAAGAASYKVYDSMNGAENALGLDIDGVSGVGSHSGKVTVVMLNNNGGDVDHLIVLLGNPTLDATDFTL